MKLFPASGIAALGTVLATAGSAGAFQQQPASAIRPASTSFVPTTTLLQNTATDAPCATPDIEVPEGVTAKLLRSATLINADGETVSLGGKMGQGTSVVVFLRHLGWPYCWTYAKDWCELVVQQKEQDGAETSSIAGPIFISIGDAEKLNVFLDKNPHVPRDQALVDNYSFGAYKAAGFGRFDEQDDDLAKEALKNMEAPALGLKGAWNYATSVMKVSPIPKDLKFGDIPEGVLRLGGTFVVDGDEILYRWSDRLPGDHPDINKVWSVAKEAALSKKSTGLQFPKFFGL